MGAAPFLISVNVAVIMNTIYSLTFTVLRGATLTVFTLFDRLRAPFYRGHVCGIDIDVARRPYSFRPRQVEGKQFRVYDL